VNAADGARQRLRASGGVLPFDNEARDQFWGSVDEAALSARENGTPVTDPAVREVLDAGDSQAAALTLSRKRYGRRK